jgi:hypothetical protein
MRSAQSVRLAKWRSGVCAHPAAALFKQENFKLPKVSGLFAPLR